MSNRLRRLRNRSQQMRRFSIVSHVSSQYIYDVINRREQSEQLAQPSKLTKTAQKKAARLARAQAKEAKKQRNASSSVNSERSPQITDRDSSPPGSKANPVEIPPEPEVDSQTAVQPQQQDASFVLEAAPPPKTAPAFVPSPIPLAPPTPTPVSNGHAQHASQSTTSARPSTPASQNKPPAFPTSPVDMAMRRASQSFTVGPVGKKLDAPESPRMPQPLLSDAEKSAQDAENVKKRQSFLVRTLWTLIMIGGFLRKSCSNLSESIQLILPSPSLLACRACIHDCASHGLSNTGIPRSDCAFRFGRTEDRREGSVEQNFELVLLRSYKLLSLRREHHLLF